MKDVGFYAERIMNHVMLATDGEMQQGLGWYALGSDICRQIARRYNLPYLMVCAVMAALSPRKRWDANVSLCNRVCAMLAAGEDVRTTNLHTQDNLRKVHLLYASRYANYAAMRDMLGVNAPKVKAFFFGLAFGHCGMKQVRARTVGDSHPQDDEMAMVQLASTVALDRHAIRVCDPDVGDRVPPAGVHLDMRMAYVEATLQLQDIDSRFKDLAPHQVQAIAWVVVRGSSQ